jgi:hypothetical protein
MEKIMKNTLVVLAVLVLAAGIFFGGWIFARFTSFGFGGMMDGFGLYKSGYGSGGMMGGSEYGGMMGGGGGYGGMMGSNNYSNADPLTIDQMRTAAETYIQISDLAGLEVGEIMIFDNNAYAIVMEKETGLGAFELLVNSGSQVAYPEYGPNMMWNLKYGMMSGGMMGGGRGGSEMMTAGGGMMGGSSNGNSDPANVSADMPVTPEQALNTAQAYLDQYIPGAIASSHATRFYGYYTLDYEIDGRVVGMLSVNGFSSQVFLHTWHGNFIEESDME